MVDEIFSEIILDLHKNPQNFGKIKKPDITSSGGNPTCGDVISFEIKLEKNKIKEIKFTGEGCAISKASASILTCMAKGKTLEEAKKISSKQLLEKLGGVIQTRMSCALVGLEILKKGIEKFEQSNKNNPNCDNFKI